MGRPQLCEGLLSSLRNICVLNVNQMVRDSARSAWQISKKNLICTSLIDFVHGWLLARDYRFTMLDEEKLEEYDKQIDTQKRRDPAANPEEYWAQITHWELEKNKLLNEHLESLEGAMKHFRGEEQLKKAKNKYFERLAKADRVDDHDAGPEDD